MTKTPAVLVVGHPGHELRVHGWLEATRPIVMILTDGSGTSGRSRLVSSTKVLENAGAPCGPIYGRLSDAAVYRAVLDHDVELFIGLAEEMADLFVRDRIECVVGDATEGFNPTHDICRMLINTAVSIAEDVRGTVIGNFSFPLVASPDLAKSPLDGRTVCFELDDAALGRKLRAADAYVELAREVAAALKAWGTDAFRKECLRRVDTRETHEPLELPPFYERYGEERVASGAYQQVVRYNSHMRPLADALSHHVGRATGRIDRRALCHPTTY